MKKSGGDQFSFLDRLNEPDGPAGVPPYVAARFEELAFQVIRRDFGHYSADAILHQIRWHEHIERGDREFKCNNNWTASLSRWFMTKHPQHAGFFETRVRRSEETS